MLNQSIHYHDGTLHCDSIPVAAIIEQTGTPAYIYSLRRALANLHRLKAAFAGLDAHIHFSAKANANLSVLRTLTQAGAGIDAVSGGEIYRALRAGADPQSVVFAGVGKSPEELRYAVEQGIGWINVENLAELDAIDAITAELNRPPTRVALRLNPDVMADTHPNIATGHGGAKFGVMVNVANDILSRQGDYPHIRFAGIHIHIGSQLGDVAATKRAVEVVLALIAPYPDIRTVNIGGGLPIPYKPDARFPTIEDFASALTPLLKDYTVLLEPGRSIIADAGILAARILYVKKQGGQVFYIIDAGMTDLVRPALYGAHHEIVPVKQPEGKMISAQVVGPVCETTDVLGKNVRLPEMQPGDLLAILTTGAYGLAMANNYNARLRPPEVVVAPDGESWRVARRRETWDDLVSGETLE